MSYKAVSDFVHHHYRHFNAAALIDAADAYVRHLQGGGKMFMTLAGAMSTGELGLSLADMIRARQGARDLLHRRESGGGPVQSRRARPLRAHPRLSGPDARGRGALARAPSESRHRHLHPRRGGDPAHRARRAGGVDERPSRDGQELFPARVPLSHHPQRRACARATRSIPQAAGWWRPARRICR